MRVLDASVAKKTVKPGTTKRVVKFAAPYTGLLAIFLLFVTLGAVVGIANPLIYRWIINNGILGGNARLIIELSALVVGLGLLDAALGLMQSFIAAKVGARIVLSLRTTLFEHIQRMSLAFFTRTQTGALVSRLNNDVTGAQGAFTDILSNVVGNVMNVTLILAAMFVLWWQVTLMSLILVPLFVASSRIWGRKLQQTTRESFDLAASMNNLMVEHFNVAGAQLTKLFGRQQDETEAFRAKAGRVSDIGITRAIYSRLFFSSLTLMAVFASALTYGWGGILIVRHKLDLGTVVAFVSYLTRLYGPLMGISNIQVNVMTALVTFERVFEVLDLQPLIKEKPDATSIPAGPARIAFDHVSFRYPTAAEISLASLESVAMPDRTPEKEVLGDISFEAKPGELVALVGPSGAGKTTITSLVTRLYDVQGGSVSINGVDVRDATFDSLRQRIGVVTQDAHFFHDTIRANLLYARPDAGETEIAEALRAAQILPLINSLPKGLDTMVGESGYRFSGGEKQRLAIARLILKTPDIVILDEATAHLDSESETAIQRAFDTALSGRTCLVIAHRLSTILKANQILVIQAGRVVERGTHAELLACAGLYSDLHQRQYGDASRLSATRR